MMQCALAACVLVLARANGDLAQVASESGLEDSAVSIASGDGATADDVVNSLLAAYPSAEKPPASLSALDRNTTDAIANEENLEAWLQGQQWRAFTSSIGKRTSRRTRDVVLKYVTIRGNGSKGILSVSLGRAQPITLLDEFLYDMSQMGYSPIYVYAHRGQGESDRIVKSKDSTTHYVQKASDLVADFVDFMTLVEEETRGNPEDAEKPHFHQCHSLGCGVALAYMSEAHWMGKKPVFQALVASSPLLQVDTTPFPYPVAVALAKFLVGVGRGQICAPTTCTTFTEEYGKDTSAESSLHTNRSTHSFQRYERRRLLCHKYRDQVIGNDGHKGICLADTSSGIAMVGFNLEIQYLRKLAKKGEKLSTPILFQQGTLDQVVIPANQEEFCSTSASQCTLTSYPGYHDLQNEADEIRDLVLQEMDEFFQQHNQTLPEDAEFYIANAFGSSASAVWLLAALTVFSFA